MRACTLTRQLGADDVPVSWHLHPVTFWRRLLLARIRQRRLRRTEVPACLSGLQDALETRLAGG